MYIVFNAYISVLEAVFDGCLLKDVTEIEIVQFNSSYFVLFWTFGNLVNQSILPQF